MEYSIIYSSKTGNTRLLAETIRNFLTEENCLYYGYPDTKAKLGTRIYVGFWTDKGDCDGQTADFLTTLRNKEIFLFGTAGFGVDIGYFNRIIDRVSEKIDKSNTLIGSFMCQGKMPLSVRERYEALSKSSAAVPNLQRMIENFDKALSHPDEKDLENLKLSIKKTL